MTWWRGLKRNTQSLLLSPALFLVLTVGLHVSGTDWTRALVYSAVVIVVALTVGVIRRRGLNV